MIVLGPREWHIRTILILIGLVFIAIPNAACTYKGALQEQFYQPTPQKEQRVPLKVALVIDPVKHPAHVVSRKDPTVQFDIDLYPGLANAVASELSNLFSDVKIIKDPRNWGDANLLAFIAVKSTETSYSEFDLRVELNFQDPASKQQVLTVFQDEVINVGMSGTTVLWSVLTGLSFFLLSPITMNMAAASQGHLAVEVLEQKLPGIVRTVSSYIKDDQKLLAFARGRLPGASPQLATTTLAQPLSVVSDVDKLPSTKALPRPNAYAVVVGIEQYRQKLPSADFAMHDAQVMSEYLTNVMGFPEENVIVLLNDHAGRTDIEKYIEKWLLNRVEKDDFVFIYYAGHGAPNPKSDDAYLVPYDGDPAYIDTTGYPLRRLYEALAKLPTPKVVAVLDAGFSGAGGRSVIAKGMRPMVLSNESAILAGGSATVLLATSRDEVSSAYDAKGHGLLTYFVLKGLQGEANHDKDGALGVKELFDYVKVQVARVARRELNNEQTPQLLRGPSALGKNLPLLLPVGSAHSQ